MLNGSGGREGANEVGGGIRVETKKETKMESGAGRGMPTVIYGNGDGDGRRTGVKVNEGR